jgi:2-polyprenyl-3-methyl-5-hydroxy-6-metoxy-1,4-benzoquinol methylase
METPLPQRRFRSAARHYLSGRPAYSAFLIRRVVELCALNVTHKVLDLGTGPGQLARAFAPFVAEVTAMDPEPEMLQIARKEAASGHFKIRFVQGGSYDLGRQLGQFQAVTIGRAFHWMDRAATLNLLDAMIESNGAVVLFDDNHPQVPENSWHSAYEKVIERYSEDDVERQKRGSPEWLKNEAILLASPFHEMERISIIERRSTALERFTDRALSLSITSRDRLGARADDLASEIEDLMAGYALNGGVTEVIESTALIARRNAPR